MSLVDSVGGALGAIGAFWDRPRWCLTVGRGFITDGAGSTGDLLFRGDGRPWSPKGIA